MLRRWLNGHLTTVVTTALGIVLAMAAGGTWQAALEFERLQERIENRGDNYEQRFDAHEHRLDTLRARIQWLERNRDTSVSLWGVR